MEETISPLKDMPLKNPSKRTVGNTSLEKDEQAIKFRRYENTNKKQPDQQKTNNAGPKQNPKPFIIDGLKQKFQNVEATTKEIKRCKPELKIDSIRLLHKGGVLVFVKDNKSFNMAPKDWPANAFAGQKNIHLTSRHDIRPTLCVNKFSIDSDIEVLRMAIEENNVKTQGIRRLTNAKGRITTLIIFKVIMKSRLKHF